MTMGSHPGDIENLELSQNVIQGVFGNDFCNDLTKLLYPAGKKGSLKLGAHPESQETRTADNLKRDRSEHDETATPPPAKSRRTESPSQTSSTSTNTMINRGLISIFDLRRFNNPQQFTRPRYPAQEPNEFQILMNQVLTQAVREKEINFEETTRNIGSARLGPNTVNFDLPSHFGSFIMHQDRLGLVSQCNFGSIRANVCVLKGKWQYEMLLGTKGIMQLGWATLQTPFEQEKGVGDSADSFAFDGNRVKKWNGTPMNYGEQWQIGDIIGCCIDLDGRNIEFYRNGKSLGIAFTNIPLSQGIAYFPTVSLSWGEQVSANFGANSFRYPINGFLPLQLEKSYDDAKLNVLLNWLAKVIKDFETEPRTQLNSSDRKTLEIIKLNIFRFIGSAITSDYAIENSFMPFYAKLIGLPEKSTLAGNEDISEIPITFSKSNVWLGYMWGYLQEDEIRKCIEKTCKSLFYSYRGTVQSLSYTSQLYSLKFLTALADHRATRRYLIHHLLFDQIKLQHFLHVKPVDEEVLKTTVPRTWWVGKSGSTSREALDYELSINEMQRRVRELEHTQIQLLKLLLTNSDGTDRRPSSRSIFLRKFRSHIKETVRPAIFLNQPMNKAMCTFFRILKVVSELWSEEVSRNRSNSRLPDLPPSIFYNCTIDFEDSERLGGMPNFLFRTHHTEVSTDLGITDYIQATATTADAGIQDTPMPSFLAFNALSALAGLIPLSSLSTPSVSNAGSSSINTDQRQTHTQASSPNFAIAASRASVPSTSGPPPPPAPNPGVELDETLPIIFEEITAPNAAAVAPFVTAGTMNTDILGIIHPPSAITSFSHTENVPELRIPSTTSSAEDINATTTGTNTGAGRSFGGNRGLIGNPLASVAGGALVMTTPLLDGMTTGTRTFRQLFQGGGPFFQFTNYFDRVGARPNSRAAEETGRNVGEINSETSLRELLDDAILIFSCGLKHHIEKVVTYRKHIDEYSEAIEHLEQQRANSISGSVDPEHDAEISKSIEIFKVKLDELSRNMAWIKSAVFTRERQQYVFELLKIVLNTLKTASSKGVLFAFVPDYYITALLHLTYFLIKNIHPTVPYQNLGETLDGTVQEVAEFIANHFADSRIGIDTRDNLTAALSTFILDPYMLSALENISEESRVRMIRALVRPYENRAWAQSNAMLVRFWQGSGFAFQYPMASVARKSFRARNFRDTDFDPSIPPNPSHIFQNHISHVLSTNRKVATQYIHSVLNQLNWSFSEFVGLLQDIHGNSDRNEPVYMESRQIRICCNCFELTQSLLRALEMVANLAPLVFADTGSTGSGTNESLLSRLCMLVCQVLNRIGTYTGTFAQVLELNIAGLETVTYYPIMAAISGILVALIRPELSITDQNRLVATKTLLREPSFVLWSLDFLLGRNLPFGMSPELAFSLEHYVPEDVSSEEFREIKKVLEHLGYWATHLDEDNESISDEEICTICYAYPKTTTLKPCNHRSCRACILHHLMNRGECFFCKGIIQQVIADDGSVIIDRTKTPVGSEISSSTSLD